MGDRPLGPSAIGAAALVAGAAILLALAPRPPVDNTVGRWLQDDAAPRAAYADLQRRFGSDDVLVVAVHGADALDALRRAVDLQTALGADPAVTRTLGPADAWPDAVALLLDDDLGGAEALARLAPRFAGPLGRALRLFEPDRARAAVLAFLPLTPAADRARLEALIDRHRASARAAGATVRAAGDPLLNLALDRAGRRVDQVALPVLVALCVGLLLAVTRSLRLTGAALAPVGLGVFAAEGALGIAGGTSNLVVDIAKPLLFVLLLAGALHLIVGWQDARRAGVPADRAAAHARRTRGAGVALALVTTAVGFGSMALSSIGPLRTFGAVAAFGLLFGVALLLVLLPALLDRLARPARFEGAAGLATPAIGLVSWGARHRGPIVAASLVVVAAGAFAFRRLPIEADALTYFPADHPVRADHEALEAAGFGLFTVEAVVDVSGEPLQLATLARLDAFGRAAAELPAVQTALGLPLLLREASVRSGGPDALPQGPVLADALAQAKAQAPLVDEAGRALRLSMPIAALDPDALDGLRAALRARFAEAFAGTDARLTLTGRYPLLLETQRALLSTLVRSLLATAVVMELVLLLALRRVRLAVAALLPNALPVCLNFVIMSLAGIPLDVGTAMTGAVALGIAVDDTLHFLLAWRKGGREAAARGTGRALVLSTVVITLGFFTLLPAEFGPTRRFGLLCGTSMITALLADLVVLPALLGGRDGPPGRG
ncbi:MAG: MMPL family transporter [Myxococcales bacterium]|nr:MMPL family transporter [Myxococcales bacterium]